MMTPDEQRQFVTDRLRDNPNLTRFHFTAHCSISTRLIKEMAESGVKFGSSVGYREKWRNTKI